MCPFHTWIVGSKPHYDVTVVGHGDGVLEWGQVELSVQQTAAIQIESMAQVDLLDGGIGRAAHTDHVEQVTVQVERMAQIVLLYCRRNGTSSYGLTSLPDLTYLHLP